MNKVNNAGKMENSMTGTGIEFKILLAVKYIAIWLFVWFIEPIIGLFVLQADTMGFLNPNMRSNLDDIKIILGVVVAFLLAVKYFYDILKAKKK